MGVKRANYLADAFTTDSTADNYTAKVPTTTEPANDGVVVPPEADNPAGGAMVPEHVILMPWGSNAANEIFAMRVWGWSYDITDKLWAPYLLYEVTCTLGNIAASKGANTFYADTLVVVAAQGDTDTANTVITSPTGDETAFIRLATYGAAKLEFDVNLDTAASANCSYRFMD